MTPQAPDHSPEKRLAGAYHRMQERIKNAVDSTEKDTLPRLQDQIGAAKEKAVELGELSREEADKIGTYLRRDLTDAAEFLADTGKQLHFHAPGHIAPCPACHGTRFTRVAD